MALDKTALANGIKELQQDMITRDADSFEEYAERLASLIDLFVKSGDVQAGITLTAGSYSGATTGIGKMV
jgi:hypothetical protein